MKLLYVFLLTLFLPLLALAQSHQINSDKTYGELMENLLQQQEAEVKKCYEQLEKNKNEKKISDSQYNQYRMLCLQQEEQIQQGREATKKHSNTLVSQIEKEFMQQQSEYKKICNDIGFEGEAKNTYEGVGPCLSALLSIQDRNYVISLVEESKKKCAQNDRNTEYKDCVLNNINALVASNNASAFVKKNQMDPSVNAVKKSCFDIGHQEGTKELDLCVQMYPFTAGMAGEEEAKKELTPKKIREKYLK